MENAVDALKIAFAVFVFVMALSLAMYMFTMAGETADLVLAKSDVTGYMDYEILRADEENVTYIGDDRIVGLETIIPTLYKYYKENYTVIFLEADGTPMKLYETQTRVASWSTSGYHVDKYPGLGDTEICSFDLNEEISRHEPWTGSAGTGGGTTNNYGRIKENIDHFLFGGEYSYSVSWTVDGTVTYDYGNGFIKDHENDKFRESIGEYTYNEGNLNNNSHSSVKTKRVIVYTLLT